VTDIKLKPIGMVRSPYRERKGVPRLGAAASVEIFPEYADGLLRLEKNSHVWVLAWLDRAERDILQVIPRGIAKRTAENLHGVFAVRSPVRPNPIGLTLARIIRAEGARIDLDRLDFMDGTPVIDLKPYFLSRDAVYAARNTQIGKPLNREALREALRMQALNFHGEENPQLELAVDLFAEFRADVLDFVEPSNLRVTAPLAMPVLADAFIGMARVRPGNRTLEFTPENKVRLACDTATVEFEISDSGYRRR